VSDRICLNFSRKVLLAATGRFFPSSGFRCRPDQYTTESAPNPKRLPFRNLCLKQLQSGEASPRLARFCWESTPNLENSPHKMNTLKDLIRAALWCQRIPDLRTRMALAPKGTTSSRKRAEPASHAQLMQMLQTLLVDRFRLTLASEEKKNSRLHLTWIKNGLKLPKATDEGENGRSAWEARRLTAQAYLARPVRKPAFAGPTGGRSHGARWQFRHNPYLGAGCACDHTKCCRSTRPR